MEPVSFFRRRRAPQSKVVFVYPWVIPSARYDGPGQASGGRCARAIAPEGGAAASAEASVEEEALNGADQNKKNRFLLLPNENAALCKQSGGGDVVEETLGDRPCALPLR